MTSESASKVVITGANSSTGRAILRFVRVGVTSRTFVAAVRSDRAAEQIRLQVGSLNGVVRISYSDPSSLDAVFPGTSEVIHVAGILVERWDSTYEEANVASTRSVVEASKRNGIRKLILVSAIGADESSDNRYYRTKGQAEGLLRASGLSYTILRVPLLLGSGTAAAAALRRHLRGGRARLIDGGRNLQQPLHVNDLARAAMAATELSVARDATLELVGPCSLPEREVVERAARLLSRTIRINSIPKRLLSLFLTIRQRVAGKGFSPDALEVVTADTRFDPQSAAHQLGIELTGIDEMIKDSLH